MVKSGIYIITNNINNHCYIGSAVNIRKRWNRHRSDLELQKHHSVYLQRAYNKYSKACFKYEILLFCDKSDLLFYEQRAINIYKPEYNQCPVAGSCLGHKASAETKRKLSIVTSGKNNPNFGKKHSEETKAIISSTHKGKTISQKSKDAVSKAHTGKVMSQETKAKLSLARKGVPRKPETIAKRLATIAKKKLGVI